MNDTITIRPAQTLLVRVDDGAPAKPVRQAARAGKVLRQPRLTATPAEIAEADNRYRIRVISERDQAVTAAKEAFEAGEIDVDVMRHRVRMAEDQLLHRMV